MSDYDVQNFLGEISLDKYGGAKRLITIHLDTLDKLLGEIESRPTITTPSPNIFPQPPPPKELSEIEQLRQQLHEARLEIEVLKKGRIGGTRTKSKSYAAIAQRVRIC